MNELYLERMKKLIPDEIEEYQDLLDRPLYQGLRANPLKSSAEEIESSLDFLKEKSPFASESWYVKGHYGNHPWHIEGRFYLQEPSASSAVEALELEDGMNVLDLCAAPGSKSTQIAGKIPNGFLVCNELDSKRAQALLSNLERMGVENFLCTNMDGRDLCSQFEGYFDRILVDAPCSGEGMMRKHDAASEKWSLENVLACSALQKEILASAIKALKPGGQLVFSTCTYSPEENEENAAWLLEQFPELRQLPVNGSYGRSGIPADGLDEKQVRRIFPMDGGEGHFIARFEKDPQAEASKAKIRELPSGKIDAKAEEFLKQQIGSGYSYYLSEPGKERTRIFGMNHPFLKLKKGKVLRQGVYLGDLVKKRFEPAHAFFMSARNARNSLRKAEVSQEQMDAFMHGEQLNLSADDAVSAISPGYVSLTYQGIPFGYGKKDANRITNKLPKGLRLPASSHILAERQNAETVMERDNG